MNKRPLHDGIDPRSAATSSEAAERIDAICDRFEAEWKAERVPDLLNYVAEVEPSLRGPLLDELLPIDLHHRGQGEETEPWAAYLRLLPEHADRIASLRSERAKGSGVVASTLECPQSIGELEILDHLGSGGMGCVYRARHTRLDRMVAVKVLPQDRLEDAQAVARFRREMKAVGQLDHPNIIRAMDARKVDGRHLLVLELADGNNLHELVRRDGSLTVVQACEIVRQAAAGLAEIHRCELVHRDIKPSNLQLTSAGVVKILDLGLALLPRASDSRDLTGEAQILGTLDYLAPEQADDSRDVDIRADIYSLGCTFYFLLAGRSPFHGSSNAAAKIRAHIEGRFPATVLGRCDVPAAVLDILHKMVATDPADRFSDPRQLLSALDALQLSADRRPDLVTLRADRPATAPPLGSLDTQPLRGPAPASTVEYDDGVGRTGRLSPAMGWLLAAAVCMVIAATIAGALLRWNIPKDLPPVVSPDQYHAVLDELERLNPGYKGQLKDCYLEDGKLMLDLSNNADKIRNINPLKRMRLEGLCLDNTRILELDPLREMRLWYFSCNATEIDDLSALRGMPLEHLCIDDTRVTDLNPLASHAKLVYLSCSNAPVSDLTCLARMPIGELNISNTRVKDLSVLKDMPLHHVEISGTPATDLSPLLDKPVVGIFLDVRTAEDVAVLRSMSALKKINGRSARQFWTHQDAKN